MELEVVNRNKDSIFHGDYVGRDLHVTNIIMQKDSEREFVVTHNANIKPIAYFTGREKELDDLRRRIGEGRKSVLVSGMGGIGKTHICRKLFEEYLNGHVEDGNGLFRHIGYIEYDGDMGSSLQRCLKYKEQDSPEKNREAVWRELEYLSSDGKLLLFVDNVNMPMWEDDGIKRLNTIPGAIVLTSRQVSFGGEFETYWLGFLSTEECIEIYEKIRFGNRGGRVKSDEVSDLEYVIETLAGRHTITIEHLAHLAWTKHWSVKRLRRELEENRFCLKFHKDGELVNIQKSYETLYDLSELTEAEQNILEAFSVFPYIPLAAETCAQWLLSDAESSENDDILMGLYQKGWLQFDLEQESYSMHPVFARFICEKCKPKYDMHHGLIGTCQKSLEISESGSTLECQKYIPFVESILEKIDMGKSGLQIRLIDTIGHLLFGMAEYKKASKLYKDCLHLCKEVLGEDHLSIGTGCENLAHVYEIQGKHKKAKDLYKDCLKMYEKDSGDRSLDIARVYEALAEIYRTQEKYEKAEEFYKKSLGIKEAVLSENNLETAMSYNNLSRVYEEQGKDEVSKELCKKSLGIVENILGKEHLDVALIYNNLALLYEKQMKYNKAEKLYEKSLRIRKRKLGENHPDTAIAYNNLAHLCQEKKKYEKAEKLYLKSLWITEKMLGKEHFNMAVIYNNLAYTYHKQGRYEKAESLYLNSIQICERIFGEEHLETARKYVNLAGLYEEIGEYSKAEGFYSKSLNIHEQSLGEEHPEVAVICYCISYVYFEQKKYKIAVNYAFKAYKIMANKFGLNHLNIQFTYENLEIMFTVLNPESNFEQWLEEKMKEQ